MNNNEDFTVLDYYQTTAKDEIKYQSEKQLEDLFIELLIQNGYEYLNIHQEQDLINNLRKQIENLNHIEFDDEEWTRFYQETFKNCRGILNKTKLIQEDKRVSFKRKNKDDINITILDDENLRNNKIQVIHQYEANNGSFKNRYDVTILVNGLPLVHIELKRRGVLLKEAFNQINRYERESFWSDSGLYEFVQIFVISNGTQTKYYSNTLRDQNIKEHQFQTSDAMNIHNSFEFTSYWADAKNNTINDLVDFAKTFLQKETLLKIITKYCVFQTPRKNDEKSRQLLVMRPYQIAATERILDKIKTAHNNNQEGSIEAGGYIWHTTGSGKTLTSFKTALLATKLPYIEKVIFVVDRKDLDNQTVNEYEKFQKGAANGNTSTKILMNQLNDLDEKNNPKKTKIIVTTIQKLNRLAKKDLELPIYQKPVVFIFDECHRSQFGQMHTQIMKRFKKYYVFGFTGTPIFADNANTNNKNLLLTTEQLFGQRLHTYTIVNAINDGNVLRFMVNYFQTFHAKDDIIDKQVQDIEIKDSVLLNDERIKSNSSCILQSFAKQTYRNPSIFVVDEQKIKKYPKGFNSILAVQSIEMAKKYYLELNKQIVQENSNLFITTIFSYSPNEEEKILDEDTQDFDIDKLDQTSKEFLNQVMQNYNEHFGTQYQLDGKNFGNFYDDVSRRTKKGEIDILIVVDMFLTGFDAQRVNTLWVDKNIKSYHTLVQAFSRTNRIYNSTKDFGNIVCFLNLKKQTDEAISLYGDENAIGTVLMHSFKDYYYGYIDQNGNKILGYKDIVNSFIDRFFSENKQTLKTLCSENDEKDFIKEFNKILRLLQILNVFVNDFSDDKKIISDYQMQNCTSFYSDLKDKYKKKINREKEIIDEDVVFETELIAQDKIDIDYILNLVQQNRCHNDQELMTFKQKLTNLIKSNDELRSKLALINAFVESYNGKHEFNVSMQKPDIKILFNDFCQEYFTKDLDAFVKQNPLKEKIAKIFIINALIDDIQPQDGSQINEIIKPVSLFKNKNSEQEEKMQREKILEIVQNLFKKYRHLIENQFLKDLKAHL